MVRKLIGVLSAILILTALCIPCSAAVLDQEFAPERYTNVSGNFYAENISFSDLTNNARNTYKFTLAPGQTVLADAILSDAELILQIVDDEDRICAETTRSEDGRTMCAYYSDKGGTYYLKLVNPRSSLPGATLSINITFHSQAAQIINRFPYSADYMVEKDDNGYLTYSFSLNAGDAFSVKTDENYSYLLFAGKDGNVNGLPTEYYDDGFYGYCGVVADTCTATVFIPTPVSGKILANTLAHSNYKIEDVYLPLKDAELDLSDAVIPFDDDLLEDFVDDFGSDTIDNRPIKFFRFNQQPNQVLQLSFESGKAKDINLVCGIASVGPFSGQSRLETLAEYKAGGVLTTNTLTASAGNYMLAVRNDGSGKCNLTLQAFEAFSTVTRFKATYEYGDAIDKVEIKNIFVDTNIKDSHGNLIIPAVTCIKLIDSKGEKSYYNPNDTIQPSVGNNYRMFAVISGGDITYQVHLATFSVVDTAAPPTPEDNTDTSPDGSGGLAWWMIVLIAVGVFCLLCVIFLLVYKKDINEVE